MHTTNDKIEIFLKEEFEYTAFMEDLGKKLNRNQIFDMCLRTSNDLIWFIITNLFDEKGKE